MVRGTEAEWIGVVYENDTEGPNHIGSWGHCEYDNQVYPGVFWSIPGLPASIPIQYLAKNFISKYCYQWVHYHKL